LVRSLGAIAAGAKARRRVPVGVAKSRRGVVVLLGQTAIRCAARPRAGFVPPNAPAPRR
jgi:hypothetical protein